MKKDKQQSADTSVEQNTNAVNEQPVAKGKLQDVGNGMQVAVATEVPTRHRVKDTPGRPIDLTSERQQRLAERELRKMAGEEIKRGRPVEPESERQQRLQGIELKKEAGIEVKRGRPRMVRVDLGNGKFTMVKEGTIIQKESQ